MAAASSDTMSAILERQRAAFIADGPPDTALRRNRIDRLLRLVLDNADDFVAAMDADYGTRPRDGSLFAEILGMVSVIEHTRKNLPRWARPARIMPSGRLFGVKAEVQPTPKGVVGIIGPWNFPLNLVVLPASAAFAAGNRVMIKMSELTPRTAELMASLAPEFFDPAELAVLTGDAGVAAAFSALPLDHLFFTGSPTVGALVQQAAAANLVPVTLELGGKNPVVVGARADIHRAATRIAQGRMINGGQVCVCPDYVFVPERHIEQFCDVVCDTWRAMFPAIVGNTEYCSAVNQANFDRVVGLIEDARANGARVQSVAPPGESLPDLATRKIAPTLVRDVDETMRLAGEETFGPVLTVRPYRELAEIVDYLNVRPSPLVAYWFGPDDDEFRSFVRHTRSGGVARNDFGAQMIPSDAPFGGVGRSGMGAYHGKAGFDTFTHYRSVVGSDLPVTITGRAAPPFSRSTRWTTALALRGARNRARRRLA
ncbi:coniferyl aldehyde dehydrogenase [Mycobacterium sp. SMC-4]|uniref:coniferyl aldehyde dehydrogenase n=1 Tax=Mycobacterium sp. SMC-4 TaxID=2857059 RepID=UPI0021B3A8FB|nr:coniferyl aldehyde dehydrogenase [Mycobacterium sp. SMC-4]UXA20669.1 coniferyl aldehyde dehydrogenase [Mycobacterium sp. SMC-4]